MFLGRCRNTINIIHNNRIPHNGIYNIIPHEFLCNKKLIFQNLVFSVVKYFSIFLDNFVLKLLNYAFPGIFLGYDSNPSAYRIYDNTNNKMVLSRSIFFFKNMVIVLFLLLLLK